MKKYDKIIAISGAFILILAGLGIYFWVEEEAVVASANIEDLLLVSSKLSDVPTAIAISDECPFYALITTPVAVNFDKDGNQHIIPLYIENLDETSTALKKAEDQIDFTITNEYSDLSAKNFSLYIAEKYWESSEGVLIIQNNESGYNLGVPATPIASYLSIPVIVTDKIDMEVREVLDNLGVTTSLICGDLEGYEKTFFLEDIDEILDLSIEIIDQKLEHEVDYITITNPRDAWPPEVLNETTAISESGKLPTKVFFPSTALGAMSAGTKTFKVTIPEDYKYALVKIDFSNLEDPRYIEDFGDDVIVGGSLTGYCRTTAYPSILDDNGNIVEDKFRFETLLYDSGGEEHSVMLNGQFHILDSADFELAVTIEELSDPYYPVMPQFSSIAPYLTAYHEGIIFAKPEFAFSNDDHVKLDGKNLPGNAQPWFNPILMPLVNQHVYENIHIPLNKLIAKIREIDITDSVEFLKKDCYENPLYIAIVGDTNMVPHYYYRSPHNDPFTKAAAGTYGTNTPSDFIYGNIDPTRYFLTTPHPDYLEDDIYSEYPEAENIVGRIIGFDIQDASALIARTVFYDEVIESLGDWKDNAAFMVGAGADVQRLPIFNMIQQILGHPDPMKFPSGEKFFLVKRVKEYLESGDFNVRTAEKGQAQNKGFTTQALIELKKDGLANFLFFPALRVKWRQGYSGIRDLFNPKWYIQTLLGDSSELCIGGELEQNSNFLLCDGHAIYFEKGFGDILLHTLGGPFFDLFIRYIPIGLIPRTTLDRQGGFSVREVSAFNCGPSVVLAEGCGSGKIDGMLPHNNLANAYLHAGVNAYVSPTTYSAFYGALEPRLNFNGGVGFGIAGFVKAYLDWKLRGVYPPVNFNQFIFEEVVLELFDDDVSIGRALRDGKNLFLPATFFDAFRWKPVLNIHPSIPQDIQDDIQNSKYTASSGMSHHPVEKYATVFQVNLWGDPAFNPYEPCNEGTY